MPASVMLSTISEHGGDDCRRGGCQPQNQLGNAILEATYDCQRRHERGREDSFEHTISSVVRPCMLLPLWQPVTAFVYSKLGQLAQKIPLDVIECRKPLK